MRWNLRRTLYAQFNLQVYLYPHKTSSVTVRRYTTTKATQINPVLPNIGGGERQVTGGLANRNCLITGGTSGIGYSIAKSLVLGGASTVRIVSRSRSRGEEAIADIKRETGIVNAHLSVIEGDILDVQAIDEQWAKLSRQNRDAPSAQTNTLINCAGISQNALLQRVSDEEISSILKSNLEAPFILCRRFLKDYTAFCANLKRRKIANGSEKGNENPDDALPQSFPSFVIVNISSLLAQRSTLGTSVYSASKAGLVSLTRSLVLEGSSICANFSPFAPSFRANVVLPGYIDTRMTSSFSNDHKANLTRETPASRFGTPEEVASAVMWALTNEYVNGAELRVDGGLGVV